MSDVSPLLNQIVRGSCSDPRPCVLQDRVAATSGEAVEHKEITSNPPNFTMIQVRVCTNLVWPTVRADTCALPFPVLRVVR